jgi:hypothetical protein
VSIASDPPEPFADAALARRLEIAEGQANAAFVEARARAFPGSGAGWIRVAGAYAMYDGPSSPLTQTFGLGIAQPPTRDDFETIETFFADRGADVYHEVSPLADPVTLMLLNGRAYRPVEFTSVMVRRIDPAVQVAAPRNPRITVRLAPAGESALWAETAAAGWSEYPELAGFMKELSPIMAHRTDAPSFLAELDGRPIAAGALSLHEGVALLAGASTVPMARRQGAQRALLQARLRYAAEQGCDLAMMGAQPGSASQRNAERQGFRIAYTRIKWRLGRPLQF